MDGPLEMEEQQRTRWNAYVSRGGLVEYDDWLRTPGKQIVHELYRKRLKGRRVLEVGCGAGHLVRALEADDPAREITGLDLSQKMLDIAAARGVRSLVCGSGNNLPFPDGSFDAVVAAVWVFRYVEPRALGEVRRVLRPNGQFMFDVPLFFGTALEACAATIKSPRRWKRHWNEARLHLNPPSPRTWEKRLVDAGFSINEVIGIIEIPFFTRRFAWSPCVTNPLACHLSLTCFYHARNTCPGK